MPRTTDLAHTLTFLKELGELTGDTSMPAQQITLLLALAVHGQVNQSNLEALTGVKRSSNSRNIAKLGLGEKAWADDGLKLVENFEDLQDRRIKLVRLTPKGHALMTECWSRSFNQYIKSKQNDSVAPPPTIQASPKA